MELFIDTAEIDDIKSLNVTGLIDGVTTNPSLIAKSGKNITIEPYVVIGSKVIIGNNVVLKSFSHIEGAKIKNNVSVGPFARVRPGTKLESGTRIGNFVETKNSKIDSNSKVVTCLI